MNKIIQMKDADGNLMYPIGYAQGGMKMDLLWTNPNPNSEFVSQTISLDLSEYSFIYIEYMAGNSTTIPNKIITSLLRVGLNGGIFAPNSLGAGGFGQIRGINVSTSGIEIQDARWIINNNSDNAYTIPLNIYGIKLAWVVPTQVNSLSYEEDI